MAVSPAMELLFDRLNGDAAFRQAYLANPGQAVADFAVTTHELNALAQRDLAELTAVGLQETDLAALPETAPPTPAAPRRRTGGSWGWIPNSVQDIRRWASRLRIAPGRGPRPPGERPPDG